MRDLEKLAAFVADLGGTFVMREEYCEGGDTVERLIYKVSGGEIRLAQSIRDGLSCWVRKSGTDAWKSIFAFTVPGFETMDIDASIEWVTSVPQGQAYLSFLESHIATYCALSGEN